jgi:hypothetical protein
MSAVGPQVYEPIPVTGVLALAVREKSPPGVDQVLLL